MKTKLLTQTALFAALTAAGAFIRIPFPTGAISLQFFITVLAGLMLSPTTAALSQTVYLVLGLVGLPIFAEGGGLGYLLRPTFGYILGLIPAAWLIARGKKHPLCAGLAGLAVLYTFGLFYLALIVNGYLGQNLSLSALLTVGMLAYLPGDLLKILTASWLARRIGKRLFR